MVQRELSGNSWLKGLIDKRAKLDTPIAQFDGPGGIPIKVFKTCADEKHGTHSVYLACGQDRSLSNVARNIGGRGAASVAVVVRAGVFALGEVEH